MKKSISVLALALAAHGAHASLTVSASSVMNFQDYDGTPASVTGTSTMANTCSTLANCSGMA